MKKTFFILICLNLAACSEFSEGPSRGPASTMEFDLKTVANKLKPFTADTCPTFPYGIEYPDQDKWSLCCVQHDVAYWKGGSSDERLTADKQLMKCIDQQNETNVSGLVYLSVRHMDTDLFPMTHRWGYGWILNRGYAEFSESDKAQIEKLEKDIPTNYKNVVLMPAPKVPLQREDSATTNYCLDGVITFIEHQLHRTLTPMRVEHTLEPDAMGFVETIKINDRMYPEPYEFQFFMNNKVGCTLPPAKRPRNLRLQLKSFSY